MFQLSDDGVWMSVAFILLIQCPVVLCLSAYATRPYGKYLLENYMCGAITRSKVQHIIAFVYQREEKIVVDKVKQAIKEQQSELDVEKM